MADGNAVAGGSGWSRWNWHAFLNVSAVRSDATSVTYGVTLGYSSYYAINVHANGGIDGGSGWNGSIVANGNGYWQGANVAYSEITLRRTGSAYNHTFSGYVQATGGYGNGTSRASVTVTVPTRDYSAPRPPKGVTLARKSDTRADLAWATDYDDANGAQPWHNVLIERSTDDGGFVQIATLSWEDVNYTDNGISAGHKYAYRIRSKNPAGYSSYVSAGEMFTSPLTPKKAALSTISGTRMRLSVTAGSPYADEYLYQMSLSGGSWSAEKSMQGTADVEAGGGEVRARVRAKKSGLYSGYRESNAVTTITAPSAPTIGGFEDVYALPATAKIRWNRVHPDGSEQTAAQVEVTYPGGSVKTFDVAGSTAEYGIKLDAEGEYRIRVRTKGLDPSWGAWSAPKAIFAENRPQAYFTTPSHDGTVVNVAPFTVEWEIETSSGVSRQSLTAKRPNGIAVGLWPLGSDVRSFTFGPDTFILESLVDWTIELTVWDGYSLKVVAKRVVRTDYAEPAIPNADIRTDPANLSVSVRALGGERAWTVDSEGTLHSPEFFDGSTDHVPVGSGFGESSVIGGMSMGIVVPTTRLSVMVILPDGTQRAMGDDIPDGNSVIDRLPPLNTEYHYLITAYSDSGTATTNKIAYTVDSDGREAFNYGADASSAVLLGLDAQCDSSVSHGGELFNFALGSQTPALPSFYPDGTSQATGTRSYAITDVGEYRKLDSVARDPANAVCWYRDHWGGRHRVKADWRLGYAAASYLLWSACASVTEVMWEEPVNG